MIVNCIHSYTVFNTETKKISIKCAYNACYSTYTKDYKNFNKEDTIQVFINTKNCPSLEICKWWTRCLNNIGLPVKHKISTNDECYGVEDKLKVGEYHTWTIDCSKYKNISHLIMCLHLLRECFGYGQSKNLKLAKETFDKHRVTAFNAFLYSCFIQGSTNDHKYYYQFNLYRLITNKELKEYFKNIKISNNTHTTFATNLKLDTNYRTVGLNMDSTFKEYEKIIKKL